MKTLVVYWHPEKRSFNNAMLQVARNVLGEDGNEVRISDLYDMDFDPVSSRKNFKTVKDPNYLRLHIEEIYATEMHGFSEDLESEIEKVEWCDLLVWQFPLWWFGLPAVFKGWVDRVFALGRLYGWNRAYETGFLSGKRALLSLTTGGKEDVYSKCGFHGDIYGILRPIHRGILQYVGFDVLAPQIVYAPDRMTAEQRSEQLSEFANRLRRIEEECPIDVGSY
jgi:NAD(P)H dehydrogenase (quinone)